MGEAVVATVRRVGIASAWRTVRRGLDAFVWYVKSVLGENDYQRYAEHLARHHPGTPVPTVKQYWRDRYDEESRHPQDRCC